MAHQASTRKQPPGTSTTDSVGPEESDSDSVASTASRDAQVLDNLGLAYSLARRYMDRGVELDDLRQVAVIGLVKAVDRFDPSRGVPFAGFAVPTILGELKRHFRDQGWTVRVPRRLKVLRRNADAACQLLEQRLGRSPTVYEVATELGADPDDVVLAMGGIHSCYQPDSLDERLHAVGDDHDPAETACDRAVTDGLLARLGERDQQILVRRFRDGWTQQAIADEVGISQMHVSRLLRACLENMRADAA